MLMRVTLYVLLFTASGLVAFNLPISYRSDDLKDYITQLTSVSGMVFTIMGIWIAFIYPNALSRLVSPQKIADADFSENLLETKRLEKIVAAVLQSALVATGLLSVLLCKIIFWRTGLYAAHAQIFKSGALALTILASWVQVEAVGSVIFANVMFINDLYRKRQLRRMDLEL
jgi:hypothetical protein